MGSWIVGERGPEAFVPRATTPHTIDSIDEALHWATSGGVRVWPYIDKLLDARLEAQGAA